MKTRSSLAEVDVRRQRVGLAAVCMLHRLHLLQAHTLIHGSFTCMCSIS